jgi:hypothetical protein
VVSSGCVYFHVLEVRDTDIVASGWGVVTRLPAARSAKVMGRNFNWAVVWQVLATCTGFWQLAHVTSSLLR